MIHKLKSKRQCVWLDCDSVDSLALCLALNCLDMFGISTSYGAYSQSKVYSKMQSRVRNVPVYPGCSQSLALLTQQDLSNMQYIHNEMNGEKFTLVVCGPHTNTAVLLREFPLLGIERIILVGGSSAIGVQHLVLNLMFIKTLNQHRQFSISVRLDKFNQLWFPQIQQILTNQIYNEIQKLNTSDSQVILSEFDKVKLAQEEFNDEPRILDAIAIYYTIQPNAYRTMDIYVQIELESQLSYGRSICDKKNIYKKQPNVIFCKDIDMDSFLVKVIQCLS